MTAVTAPAGVLHVTRARRSALWAGLGGLVLVAVLGYLPYMVFANTTSLLDQVFYLIAMASMWNLLAGYAGLVSVGQQAFIGLGAYAVIIPAQHGMNAFEALPLAIVIPGIAGLIAWWLVSRLRTGYFAIATWVIATIAETMISRYNSLGGGTGVLLPLPASLIGSSLLGAIEYWIALGVAVLCVGAVYLILRSRTGLALTAIRDDETAAHGVGARVGRTQRLVFVVAAAGCGAAGAVYMFTGAQFLQPSAAFNVAWSAKIIFITIIGGIGTIEGPILGTIVYIALQQMLANYGTWYFIVLGLVAMTIAIWAPRGLWGLVADRFGIRLFPVGYWVKSAPNGTQSSGSPG